jgi:hypothetical protein
MNRIYYQGTTEEEKRNSYAAIVEENNLLKQQLADAHKKIVELQDALIYCKVAGVKLANVDDALAATQDLSGLVLCDAELIIFSDFQTKPLYKARKP